MNEVKLHVEGLDSFFKRASAVARRIDQGDARRKPAEVSFESMETLLKVLTPNRWALLRRLRAMGSSSVRALARSLERDYRGVHADVATLREVGLIDKQTDGAVYVPWSRITAEMSLEIAA